MLDSRVKLHESIGSGGFGDVHRATVTDLPELVAVKLLRLPDQASQQRFTREVMMLQRLDHDNIIPILDYDLNATPQWFAMPLADSTLQLELIRGALHMDRIQEIFRQILLAVAYAHAEGVIHRDLKPSNILLDADNVYVSDFGLGKQVRLSDDATSITITGSGFGSRGYAAPEQHIDLKHVDARADIYSLGTILYYMVTGRRPLLGFRLPKVPDQFYFIVSTCIKKDPRDRFQTVTELLDAFDEATNAATSRPATAKTPHPLV